MQSFTSKLREKGRFGDTLIAHLSEAEAGVLKKAGGAGTINPFTGALEFYKGTMDNKKEGDRPSTASVFSDLINVWESNQPEPTGSESTIGGSKFAENQALAVATILNNTRYVYNDKEGLHQYMYFGKDGGNPFEQSTNKELDKLLHEVSPDIRRQVVSGKGSGATNEDLAARDMSIFLKAISPSGRSGNLKRGKPLVSQDNLFAAYEKLGIKPYDYEKGKMHTKGFSGEGWTEFKTVDDNPISLAQQEVTDAARGLYSLYRNDPSQFDSSSADSDGTGGTGSAPNLGAGSFDSFSAFADAAFAPASYNQGSIKNLTGPLSRLSREGIASWAYQQFQNMMNSPTTNADGKAFANEINPETHFGDAPAYSYGGFDSGGFISAGGGYGVNNNTGTYNQNGGYSGFSNPNGVGD